jgi:L-arabinose transport system substrate-binding protein
MSRKILAFLVMVVMLAGIFTACGSAPAAPAAADTKAADSTAKAAEPEAKKDLTFVIMVKRADEPWFQVESKGFEEAAKAKGVKAIVMDNKMDPNAFLTNMDNAIAQKVDGIAVCIPDQKMSKAAVDKAKAAGIPIIAVDDTLIDESGKELAPFVGMNGGKIGVQVGEWLAEEINKAGWLKDSNKKVGVAAITYDQLSVIKERTDGSKKALLEKCEGLKPEQIFEANYKNTDAVGSLEAMQGLITSHPEITNWVIYSGNDEGVVGAVRALEQAGKDKDAIGCGLGAGLAKGEFEKANPTAFKASCALDSASHGKICLDELYDFVTSKKEIPAVTNSSGNIVTRDNYKDVLK